MQNFQRLTSELPVKDLSLALKKNPELWDQITKRQDYEGSAHRDTKCIVLRWGRDQSVEAAFSEIPTINYPAMGILAEQVLPIINTVLRKIGGNEIGRVLITSLKPGGTIQPHIDEGLYADHYERFHVVIDSEDGNLFYCGDEVVRMQPGELWCFNHKKSHWVFNGSFEPRIHLVIDAVAPDFRRERE